MLLPLGDPRHGLSCVHFHSKSDTLLIGDIKTIVNVRTLLGVDGGDSADHAMDVQTIKSAALELDRGAMQVREVMINCRKHDHAVERREESKYLLCFISVDRIPISLDISILV